MLAKNDGVAVDGIVEDAVLSDSDDDDFLDYEGLDGVPLVDVASDSVQPMLPAVWPGGGEMLASLEAVVPHGEPSTGMPWSQGVHGLAKGAPVQLQPAARRHCGGWDAVVTGSSWNACHIMESSPPSSRRKNELLSRLSQTRPRPAEPTEEELGHWLALPVKVFDRDGETPLGSVLRSCHASTGYFVIKSSVHMFPSTYYHQMTTSKVTLFLIIEDAE